MALRTRHDYYHADTHINTHRLVPTSRLVANITGIQVQRNKAIVGQNAFAHEAGIHQDGMLKERTHLRDHAARGRRLRQDRPGAGQAQRPGRPGRPRQGPRLSTSPASSSTPSSRSSRSWPTRKKEIYDADIAALIEQQIHAVRELWTLESYEVTCGTGEVPEVTLRLRRGDEKFDTTMACGDGPIDAIFLAIEKLTGISVVCKDFQRPQRDGRQGRPGRGDGASGTQRPGRTAAAASRPTASKPAPRPS